MKRAIFVTVFSLAAFALTAQKSAVKEAKNAMNDKRFGDARTLITPALTDPETGIDPQTWKLAGDIGYNQFDLERDKALRMAFDGVAPDSAKMFDGIYYAFKPYIKADELGEIPDAKGKIKNKVRDDIRDKLKTAFIYYLQGGSYYYDKKNFAKSSEMFELYWNMSSLPMFNNEKDKKFFSDQDTLIQVIKYYAALSAIEGQDTVRALNLFKRILDEPYTPTSEYDLARVHQDISTIYYQQHDTVAFIKELEKSARLFPENNYFITNLIDQYIMGGNYDRALDYLNQAIENDPANTCLFKSVMGNIFNEKKEIDRAEETFKEALAVNSDCKQAILGLGIIERDKGAVLRDEAAAMSNQKAINEKDKEASVLFLSAIEKFKKYTDLLINENKATNNEELFKWLREIARLYYVIGDNDNYDKYIALSNVYK